MKADTSEPATEAELLWPEGLDDICVFPVIPPALSARGESRRAEAVTAGGTDPRRDSQSRRTRRRP